MRFFGCAGEGAFENVGEEGGAGLLGLGLDMLWPPLLDGGALSVIFTGNSNYRQEKVE